MCVLSFFRHSSLSTLLNAVVMPADQIEQREQENPDNIHKVPVETHVLNRRVVFRAELATPCAHDKPGEHAQTNHHVAGMQPSHGEVEREENFGALGCLLG